MSYGNEPHRTGEIRRSKIGQEIWGPIPSPECCGQDMTATDLRMGIRIWRCVHRPEHPAVLEDRATGKRETEGFKYEREN
jgi:hypothetical protein